MAGRAQAWAQGQRDARQARTQQTQALRQKGKAALEQETARATARARARATRDEARRRAAQQVERDRREGILPPAPRAAGKPLAQRIPSVPGGGDVAGGILALFVWGWVVLPFLNPPAGVSRTQAVKDVIASKFVNRMGGNPLP